MQLTASPILHCKELIPFFPLMSNQLIDEKFPENRKVSLIFSDLRAQNVLLGSKRQTIQTGTLLNTAAGTNSFPACSFPSSQSCNQPAAGEGAEREWQGRLLPLNTPHGVLAAGGTDSSVGAQRGKHAFNLTGQAKSRRSHSKTQQLGTRGHKPRKGTCARRAHTSLRVGGVKQGKRSGEGITLLLPRTYLRKANPTTQKSLQNPQ